MKKLVLACALLGSLSAYAQAHDHQPPGPDVRANKLQKVLQLSDDQTAKIKKQFETDAQQRKALLDKYKPQFDAFQADMKKQREQSRTQLKAVLTPKQQEALDAMHEGHGEGMHGMGMGMRGMMSGKQCPMHDDADDDQPPHK